MGFRPKNSRWADSSRITYNIRGKIMLLKRVFISEILILCIFACTVMNLQCRGDEKALQSTHHDLSGQVSNIVQRFGFQDEGLDQCAFDETIAIGLSATEQLKKEYYLTKDIWVRSEICLALSRIGAKDAVPFLIDALGNDNLFNFHLKRFIIYALGELKDPRAIDPLWKQIRRPDDRFSLKIDRTDSHKSKILQEQCIDDPTEYFPFLTNDLIIRALANIGGEKVLKRLQQIASSDDYAYYSKEKIQKAIESVELNLK
ncbi:MAG: HEAT repeat domain-containing protein [Proteobacteria bacterium]|nr:HEAT repeat domain-containing protein [Pseudomonadota bacterium]